MKQVEELIERTRLTEEEIAKLIYPSGQTRRAVAQAQQDKIFKDPDLALLVKKELPSIALKKLPELFEVERTKHPEAFIAGVHAYKDALIEDGWKPVIPLANEIKEVGK